MVQARWVIIQSMSNFDFGYPWWLNYGHMSVAGVSIAALILAFVLKSPKWLMVLIGAVTLWSGSVAVLACLFGLNSVPELPTQSFLRSDSGRVLDMGAGTGRSSIMVLKARPHATVVASDLFAESFDQHFGHSENPQQRLTTNLKAAGVEQRATIETADMTKLPFENASFDAIVSSYAIDHLSRDGIKQALGEAARVVKPGGEFLLMLVANDKWLKLAFGPMAMHGGFGRGPEWWGTRAKEAGFEIMEQGTAPITLYFLLTRMPNGG